MAQETSLVQRVRSLLDAARSHVPLGRAASRFLLVASVVLVTTVAVIRPGTRAESNDRQSQQEPAAETEPDAATDKSLNTVEDVIVTGTVLLPDGTPAKDATVRASVGKWAMMEPISGPDYEPPTTTATTDAGGSFSIEISTQPFGDVARLGTTWQDIWKRTNIAASLPGYGGQWVEFSGISDDRHVTLQLTEDIPIRGRVVNLEGEPVDGVEVRITELGRDEDEDLSAWIAAARNGELPEVLYKRIPHRVHPSLVGLPTSVKTDDDGRFQLSGIGREREVSVELRHASAAHVRDITVVTRKMESFDRVVLGPPFETTALVYGSDFTHTVAPSRAITGIVRDAETNRPLPGVSVESYKFATNGFSNLRDLTTVTDKDGTFRLTGMPKGNGNRIIVVPNDDQPYFVQQLDVPNPAGLGPVTVDVALHRGIWITGRVSDMATGEPVHARLHLLPYRSNEYAQALPEYGTGAGTDVFQTRYQTKADGTYRLVGLPGLSIVGAESVHKQYLRGVGYDQITGKKYRDTDSFDTYSAPVLPGPKWPNAMAEVDISEEQEEFVVDFQMVPGETVSIATLDASGRPLAEVDVTGFRTLIRDLHRLARVDGRFADDKTRRHRC